MILRTDDCEGSYPDLKIKNRTITAVEIHLQQAVIRRLWTSMDDFWTSMDVYGHEWTKNEWTKKTKMDKKGQKWTKIDVFGQKCLWTSIVVFTQKWTKIDAKRRSVDHRRPWTSMDSVYFCPFLCIFVFLCPFFSIDDHRRPKIVHFILI